MFSVYHREVIAEWAMVLSCVAALAAYLAIKVSMLA